jgi:hypothetical protein
VQPDHLVMMNYPSEVWRECAMEGSRCAKRDLAICRDEGCLVPLTLIKLVGSASCAGAKLCLQTVRPISATSKSPVSLMREHLHPSASRAACLSSALEDFGRLRTCMGH